MGEMNDMAGELGADKDELDALIEFSNNLTSFVNENEGNVLARLALYKKPLDTVTDVDIRKVMVNSVTDARAAAIKKVLGVMNDMVQVIKPIKNKLPVNDIEA